MLFNYQARTENGEAKAGSIEAPTKDGALELLQKYGLFITFLEETRKTPVYSRKIKFLERISAKEIVLFSRQLSIMFGANVSLVEALRTLASQMRNPVFKEKIIKISEDIEAGSALSAAFSKYPKIFSSFYIAMVRAGEAAGKLSDSLNYLAEHMQKEYELKARIKGAMIYPSLIVFVAVSVVIFMVFFVVPMFKEIFASSEQELPFITKAVIAFSDFVKKWGLILLLATVFLIAASVRYLKSKEGKKKMDEFMLKAPVLGSFLKMVYLTRFAENLSTLISGGLPIARALEITADIVGNSVYKKTILEARDGVRKGEPISLTLSNSPKIFTPVFIQMTLVGERTGSLEKTLLNVVNFYQKEVDRTVENLISVLEPALIVFLAVIVGGIILSVLLPLYGGISV